jgi:hypothetical protein
MAAVAKSAALLLAVLFAAGACARCAVRADPWGNRASHDDMHL